MRHLNRVQQPGGTKSVMLVEHPQELRYRGGVCLYFYLGDPTGHPDGGEFYDEYSVEQVKAELENLNAFPSSGWIAIPDQVAGCRDDCVAPIRAANPLLGFTGFIDPNHPLEQEFLKDLARFRQEDLERTLREYEQADPPEL